MPLVLLHANKYYQMIHVDIENEFTESTTNINVPSHGSIPVEFVHIDV